MNIRELDIAIIGMSCRFPGAKDVKAFWQNLRDGVESISFFSNQELSQSDQTLLSNSNYVKAGAVLPNIEEFDASFFGYSTKDAEIMDPQQRIFLECAWEALESAGYNPETYQGLIGVYAGSGMNTYLINNVHPNRGYSLDRTFLVSANDLQIRLSNGKDYLPTRVSYKLNLRGPSVNIQTACSTALVAIHMACQSLLNGECDMALAGAVAICVPQKVGYLYQEDMIWSNDGHCRAFDEKASGTVFGNGGGIIVLKLLEAAIADGDCIHAVIKGSAINNDGAAKVGYTAPSVEGQAAVISEALAIAQIDPSTVTYVETHGTATSLGDPIEITALTQAFRQSTDKNGFCAIGSVKTNIGHIVEAAGIAGLIKTVLALKHKQLPPSLHFSQPNPNIDFANSPFYVNTTLTHWETDKTPRRAGVSSFGMGGTNCHVVLEEAPEYRGNASVFTTERPFHILTLSAKTEKALRELAGRYVTDLPSHPDATLANICFTANTGRKHFNHRLAIVAASREQLRQQLGEVASPPQNPTQPTTLQEVKSASKIIAFLFTGQGSQYVDMGRQLYETQPTFRESLDRCDEILRAYLEKPLLEVLYPNDQSSHPKSTISSSKLDETAYTQPALFAIEYALCQLWKSWGIKPDVVVGHSVGEYVAACVAGVFSLEDGLKLIAERGRLIQALPQDGEMVSLLASQERVRQAISPYEGEVAIAAINSPESIVISGKREAIRAVSDLLIAEGIKTKKLTVSHAFHSPLIEPILGEFEQVAQQVSFSPPLLKMISNITGEVATEEIASPEYWCRHIRQPVRWAANMENLARLGANVLVEIGPKPILLGMGRHCLPEHQGLWLPSLRPPQEDWQQILTSLTELYLHGVPVDWLGFDRDYDRRREHLPTYPFQRQRYWIQEGDFLMKSNGEKSGASRQQISTSLKTTRREAIEKTLRLIIADVLQLAPTHVDFHASFFEMGADSLIIAEARQKIKNTYRISVSLRQFFEELSNLDALVAYIDQHLPPEWEPLGEPEFKSEVQSPVEFQLTSAMVAPAEPKTNGIQDPKEKEMEAKGALERIMAQQLQVMSQLMSEQLDVLRGNGLREERHQGKLEPSEIALPSLGSAVEPKPVSRARSSAPSIKSEKKETGSSPFGQATEVSVKELSPQQQQHLDTLIARYTQRTKKSKQQAQRYRSVLADLRGALGFRPEIKEMHYPIVGDHARGARFWDVDGNEYVDITMGFGVFLFGHSASFIKTVLEEQLAQGIRVGPQSNLAGEVAELIGELTGMERVNFCNSGTEAVMVALRIARATTGRSKIVMFSGAYHGHSDGTLAVAKTVNGNLQSIPMVLGVPQEMVDNIIVLPYGESGSLDIIKDRANELAAVLVEPVQSRQPDLQPQAFLQQLRQITRVADVALIFDEIITGFRVHPGGAQAWFGVEADLATYGKLLGGGMPIGVVAGKATYLDRIDGGMWSYGDCSYPKVERTFVAGTFCKHPLAMAASLAVLQHLKQESPELQQRLNEQTSRFVKTLNTYFEQEEVPFGVKHFGSLFRFAWSSNLSYFYQPLEMDLLFHHLIEKGVYIWEGRICFLSTAHTNEDVEYVIRAVKETVKEMREGGFLQNSPKNSAMLGNLPFSSKMPSATATNRTTEKKKGEYTIPLSEPQKQLLLLARVGDDRLFACYCVSVSLQLRGRLQIAIINRAVQKLVERHSALRTTISNANEQCIWPFLKVEVLSIELQHLASGDRDPAIAEWFAQESLTPFNLSKGPLFRVYILKLEENLHLLTLVIHHLVADGLSMNIMLQELAALYSAECQGIKCPLASPLQFYEYTQLQARQLEEMAAHESYLEQFTQQMSVLELPIDHPRPPINSFRGTRQTIRLNASLCCDLKRISQQRGCTLFMTLMAGYAILLHRLTSQDDIAIAIPTGGRFLAGGQQVIGNMRHLLPIHTHLVGNPTFSEYLASLENMLLDAYEHQDYSFAKAFNKRIASRDLNSSGAIGAIAATFNLDRFVMPKMFGLEIERFFSLPIGFIAFDISLNVIEIDDNLICDLEYNLDLFYSSTICRWLEDFQTLLEGIVANPLEQVHNLPLSLLNRTSQ